MLQDYCLQYLVLGLTLARGEMGTLIEALTPLYGARAGELARGLLLGSQDPSALSFAHPFLAAARGIIVHSEHVLDLVHRQLPDKPIRNVPMGVAMKPSSESKRELRQRYGYTEDDFIVASVSTRAPKKRLDIVLEALRDARARIPRIKLLVVGGGSPGAKIERLIENYGLGDIVEQTGWVAADRYQDLIRLADVAVDLRDMAAAETAHSALRCLVAGKPVVVSASGTFLELPDACCPKIVPDDRQASTLSDLLAELYLDPQRLRTMEHAALKFAEDRLTMELQAREFIAFVDEVVKSTPGSGSVELLEPRPGYAKPATAALYRLCRIGFLVRSYGVSDSLQRLRLNLTSRLKPDAPEAL